MKSFEEMKKLMEGTPAPRAVPGKHRQILMAQLSEKMEKDEAKMTPMNWTRRTAWACGLMLALAVTAWAGQKIFKIHITERSQMGHTSEFVYPDGTKGKKSTRIVTWKAKTDDQKLTGVEGAALGRQCIKLIRAGKASLIKVEEAEGGKKYYVYSVHLPDGKEVEYRSEKDILNVPLPLPEKFLSKVIKNEDGTLTGVYSIFLPDDSMGGIALGDGTKWENNPLHEIPALIEQGKGRQLEIRKFKNGRQLYIYEFTLSNGEKVNYGSLDKPLTIK